MSSTLKFIVSRVFELIKSIFVTLQSQTSPDQGKSDPMHSEMSMSCPPALRCLVFLWEQICANCIQVIQRNGINLENEQNIKDSTLIDDQNVSDFEVRKSDGKKGMLLVSDNISMFRCLQ